MVSLTQRTQKEIIMKMKKEDYNSHIDSALRKAMSVYALPYA